MKISSAQQAPLHPVAGPGAIQRPSPAASDASLQQLKRIFTKKGGPVTPGTVQFPAIGVKHHANELAVVAKLVPGDHATVFTSTKAKVIRSWEKMFSSKYDEKRKVFVNADGETYEELKATFIPSGDLASRIVALAPKAATSEVRALLKRLDAELGQVQTYDLAGDLMAEDAIVITPAGSKQSLVVSLSYVHS